MNLFLRIYSCYIPGRYQVSNNEFSGSIKGRPMKDDSYVFELNYRKQCPVIRIKGIPSESKNWVVSEIDR